MGGNEDDKILSYHDVLLRQTDLDTLEPGNWLNDQIIAFYLEYLTQQQIKQRQSQVPRDGAGSSSVLYVSPAITFLIMNSGRSLYVVVVPSPSRYASVFVIQMWFRDMQM